MQISLNQAEIEKAIREYIGKRVTVAGIDKLIIDLKASRGPEGYTAFVDLPPEDGLVAAVSAAEDLPSPVAAPERGKPGPKPKVVEPREDESPLPPEVPVEAVQEPATEGATPVVEEVTNAVETTAEPEPEADPKPAKSLFAGLQKPRNQ